MEKSRILKKVAFATGAVCAMAVCASASMYETNKMQLANIAAVESWGDATERGLRLDAEAGEVVVLAESCGLAGSATVEFPIVGELSDRDYEALFRTFARPGAIGRAIESLGVRRGRNVNFRDQNYWPQGERVTIEVAPFAATNGVWRPIQDYIIDLSARAPLAYDSFVYCGSVDDGNGAPGERLCDNEAPNSVLATYNEPQSLIEMPGRFGQSEVYERFVMAQDSGLVPFGLYKLRIRPLRGEDGKIVNRRLSATLDISKNAEGVGYGFGADGAVRGFDSAAGLAKHVKDLVAGGLDVFADVRFSDSLSISEAARQARFLSKIEGENGLRVVGPSESQIYYKGFLPDEAWRDRKGRPSQPWEMRFSEDGGKTAITLVKTIEDWTSAESFEPALSIKEYCPETAAEAAEIIEKDEGSLPVLLVFAPGTMTLSEIMPAIRLAKRTHPTIYVFAE